MDTRSTEPQVNDNAIWVWCEKVFGYLDGLVPVRFIGEKGTPEQKTKSDFVSTEKLANRLVAAAPGAAREHRAVFVVPGTVASAGSARAEDICQTGVILVDLDDGDIAAKRGHLVQHLGAPSLEVASGGKTEEGQDKLHLIWRLTEAATGPELEVVAELRSLIAIKTGGDNSFASLHQPIRVAGTIHGKHGVLSAVRICAVSTQEFDLNELADRVRSMPALGGNAPWFDFNDAASSRRTAAELMTTITREGGKDDETRFKSISKVIGHWLRIVRKGHCSLDDAWTGVQEYNEAMIRPPWEEKRLLREFQALLRKDIAEKGPMPGKASEQSGEPEGGPAAPEQSDDFLVSNFTAVHGENWKHVPVWGSWYSWTGTYWKRDEVGAVLQDIRLICREAAANTDKAYEARRLASSKTIQAVHRIAATDPHLARMSEEFDCHPMLLNTPSGIIDLDTGAIQLHDRNLLLTQITRAKPGSGCPRWLEFLETVTGGDHELKEYLGRVAGYCLTGSTKEQAFFFLHGSGANGKSVFLQTIAWVMGEYAVTAAANTFTTRGANRHLTELAGLRAARLVLVSETDASEGWAEARIKSVTGGDKIRANFMYRDLFEFTPHFKLLVAGNHRPKLGEVGEAMRRRMHVVPFTVTVPPSERDPRLQEALREEADGILGWMIDGAASWKSSGLKPPGRVLAAADDYFEDEDTIGHWIAECCVVGGERRATAKALFGSWSEWAKNEGHEPLSTRYLGDQLRSKGFTPTKVDRQRGWIGIGLRQSFTDGQQQ